MGEGCRSQLPNTSNYSAHSTKWDGTNRIELSNINIDLSLASTPQLKLTNQDTSSALQKYRLFRPWPCGILLTTTCLFCL